MNKHILKLLWNRRKAYIWIFAEQVLVSLVLVYCFVQLAIRYKEYTHPGNLNLTNVCMLAVSPSKGSMNTVADRQKFTEARNNFLRNPAMYDYVEAIHYGFCSVPQNRPSTNNPTDSLIYAGQKYRFYLKAADDNFPLVFHPNMLEGTWYKDEALDDGTYPVVITKSLVEQMNLTAPIGTRLSYENRDFRVVGVMNDFKSLVFDDPQPSAIFALSAFEGHEWIQGEELAVLVKKGRMNDFTNYFWKGVTTTFAREGHQPLLLNMEELSQMQSLRVYLSLLTVTIPTLFLIVFAFLGTFSLMYRQSKRLIGEYGLRIALGSTKNKLKSLVLWQSCLLTGIAMLLGCVFAVNLYFIVFPEVELSVFIVAMLLTIALMLVFAVISVWYPAHEASKIQPAIALKQEE